MMLLSVCQMAFFGFLRCGEFTVKTKNELQNCITIADIKFAQDMSFYTLNLKASKTDPFRQGVDIHIFENNDLKPVQTMSNFVSLRISQGATSSSVLFADSDGTVLTRQMFIGYFKHVLAVLGIDDSKYCGHSFRIGAATSAASVGVEDHLIQTLGRWASSCYVRYIRCSMSTLKNAQLQMCYK